MPTTTTWGASSAGLGLRRGSCSVPSPRLGPWHPGWGCPHPGHSSRESRRRTPGAACSGSFRNKSLRNLSRNKFRELVPRGCGSSLGSTDLGEGKNPCVSGTQVAMHAQGECRRLQERRSGFAGTSVGGGPQDAWSQERPRKASGRGSRHGGREAPGLPRGSTRSL